MLKPSQFSQTDADANAKIFPEHIKIARHRADKENYFLFCGLLKTNMNVRLYLRKDQGTLKGKLKFSKNLWPFDVSPEEEIHMHTKVIDNFYVRDKTGGPYEFWSMLEDSADPQATTALHNLMIGSQACPKEAVHFCFWKENTEWRSLTYIFSTRSRLGNVTMAMVEKPEVGKDEVCTFEVAEEFRETRMAPNNLWPIEWRSGKPGKLPFRSYMRDGHEHQLLWLRTSYQTSTGEITAPHATGGTNHLAIDIIND